MNKQWLRPPKTSPASTEEISAQAREVADLAHSAADIAKSLTDAVAMFKLTE